MKFVIVFAALFAIALAAPAQQEAQVLRYDSDVQPEGYKFIVETSDGKTHQEEGQLKDAGTDHEAIVVRGSYSYVGDDGVTYTVTYLADENGFQPEGAHLPHA
ncbi:larval cuticle protein 65Ag1 [Teleopsis dalmanni]|uniref:larval cuticle protein 65Ag1-like n=1 Tax=Teleopsis dalmanni TaxID=139649 RepID=UPI0018CF45BB|nr:larval cuticle protein 65Ag1-like [Teleopsis dalmanni]XP_037939266.1 larval cuticle protein 65Ag1 [Teleopsis dalmanni]